MSHYYQAMVRGTRELHRLAAAGMDDSPEADAIRDATDGPWKSLSELERDRVRLLSEDLYSLVESRPPTLPMSSEARSHLSDAEDARRRGDWDQALALLRNWQAYLEPARASYLRGMIWLEAGDSETAAHFLEHASSLHGAKDALSRGPSASLGAHQASF